MSAELIHALLCLTITLVAVKVPVPPIHLLKVICQAFFQQYTILCHCCILAMFLVMLKMTITACSLPLEETVLNIKTAKSPSMTNIQ